MRRSSLIKIPTKPPPVLKTHQREQHQKELTRRILSILSSSSSAAAAAADGRVDSGDFAIERRLDPLSPLLSLDLVHSILRQIQDLPRSFRFFSWSVRWRHLRPNLHTYNIMIPSLLQQPDSAFQLLRSIPRPLPRQSFDLLISAFSAAGLPGNALDVLSRMSAEFGVVPNTFTYNLILRVLIDNKILTLAHAIYNQMIKRDIPANRATFNLLIDGFCKAGKMKDALELFDEMSGKGVLPNTMTYTIVLSRLCRQHRIDDAYQFLLKMSGRNCIPDSIMYNSLLDGFCKAGRFDEAKKLILLMKKNGVALELHSYSSLINGFFRANKFDEACEVYRDMKEAKNVSPDCVIYTIMIKGYCDSGKLDSAFGFFKEMTDNGIVPDTFCYNTLIRGLCNAGLLDQAQSLKLEISKDSRLPDSATHTIMICGFCKEGLVSEAEQIFEEMKKAGCSPTVMTFNSLINGFCKAGDLKKASIWFYKMDMDSSNPLLFFRLSQGKERAFIDTAGYEGLVERLVDSGEYVHAYRLCRGLIDNAVVPNVVTYNILIQGLCRSGNLVGALELFKQIRMKGLEPDEYTYSVLVDGLQRIDRDEDALGIVQYMARSGDDSSIAMYNTLMRGLCKKGRVLDACKVWSRFVLNHGAKNSERVRECVRDGDVVGVVREFFAGGGEAMKSSADYLPFSDWLFWLCKDRRRNEAFGVFSLLREHGEEVAPSACVALIDGFLEEKKVVLGVDVFLYVLEKGVMLKPNVCNRVIKAMFVHGMKEDSIEIVRRMRVAGYDVDACLSGFTKQLIGIHASDKLTM